MALLITPDDLATYTGGTPDPALALLVCQLASGVVCGHTGQEFAAADYEHTLPVAPTGRVRLPQRPVLSVDTVTAGDDTVTGWTWDGVSDHISVPTSATAVTVAYRAGYDVVPDQVRAVALGQAAAMLANPDGLRSETAGDYSRTFNGDRGGLSAAEKTILDRYRSRVGSVRTS